MADAYFEDEASGVRGRAGAVAAVIALIAVTWMGLVFMLGFAEGVQAVGPEAGHTYEPDAAW